jgi:hypothetical protein
MTLIRLAALLTVVAACGDERVAVEKGDKSDYNHLALQTAVDEFVANGRTPQAYGDLARAALKLRPGMDRSVSEEAELKLVVLAFGPVNSMQGKPIAEQVETLALAVWPTLLSPRIAADEVVVKRDPKAVQLMPQSGEEPKAYLERLCGSPLAAECKHIVPEYQGEVVSAIAIQRATERVRNAVSDCMMCGTEPGWHEAVRSWESLDVLATGSLHAIQRRGDPDNWPVAGNAAEIGSALPDVTVIWREAEINTLGEVVIGGQRYAAGERIDALRDLRGDNETITLHLRPELTLAQVNGILADAKKSGATKVAVVARAPTYPWERRIYWLSKDGPTRVGLRPTDSLQLLLHTIDHIASPGVVARVE